MSDQNDDEPSQFEQAMDMAREEAEVSVKSSSIEETMKVVIPVELGPELRDAAEATWDQSDSDAPPRRFQDGTKRALKELVAEQKAKDAFADRHGVRTSDVEAYARTRGRTQILRREGDLRATGEVWEVIVKV